MLIDDKLMKRIYEISVSIYSKYPEHETSTFTNISKMIIDELKDKDLDEKEFLRLYEQKLKQLLSEHLNKQNNKKSLQEILDETKKSRDAKKIIEIFTELEKKLKDNDIELTEEVLYKIINMKQFNLMVSIVYETDEKDFLEESLLGRLIDTYTSRKESIPTTSAIDDFYKTLPEEVYSAEKTLELIIKAQAGDKGAFDDVVVHNLRAILDIAGKVARRYNRMDEFDNLFSIGCDYLMKLVHTFNPALGYTFSTYLFSSIYHNMSNYIRSNMTSIRLPQHAIVIQNKILKATPILTKKLGREPTVGELATELGIEEEILNRYISKLNATVVSLDAPVSEDGDEIGYFLPDKDSTAFVDDYERGELHQKLLEIIDNCSFLNEKETYTIKYRFGLIDGKEHTLEEVAKKLNVTRERVRQIEFRALSIIAAEPEFEELVIYSDNPDEAAKVLKSKRALAGRLKRRRKKKDDN